MKIDRLLSIVMLLLERRKINAPELAEMFEVKLRTIYRDIDTINQAGIPIITYRGANGGFGIPDTYKIEKKLFTISDITALLIGLGSIHSTMSSEELLNTLAKVKGLIPAEQMKDIELKSNQIIIDNTPWLGNEVLRLRVDAIKTAINENRFISFNYFDRLGNKTQRKIEPYRLVMKNSYWYIQGYCTTRNDFRIFSLLNISSLKLLNEKFHPRDIDFESLDIYFRTNRKNITVKLLVDESLHDYMVGYCGEKNVTASENNKFIAYYPFVEDDYMYKMLLQFGDKCECLEPENVRLELISRIKKALNLYENNIADQCV
ncbi:Predicted DNA-binding transcriptional regulator YafY, contains an HTH and WYL domains [Anaerocolumna jejuensis DSM 15929]|uniref:Predicted DNA-binding transcriptional regulator YafY, contains an HTH and WYL domains n=1 Tax=Anaerocolumna jejuensis DSM 15929 TaxID=1121322 RepID=A0A1M6VTU9_9FIRM|nr:YafY family protein [Anaerocolumna jejuensis]SHK84867.1 Predicted DNA-binding transcriptional regulator YafY, contains an HTH and WYL domains [Anaerocolumna jejuensis DSM 15929]